MWCHSKWCIVDSFSLFASRSTVWPCDFVFLQYSIVYIWVNMVQRDYTGIKECPGVLKDPKSSFVWVFLWFRMKVKCHNLYPQFFLNAVHVDANMFYYYTGIRQGPGVQKDPKNPFVWVFYGFVWRLNAATYISIAPYMKLNKFLFQFCYCTFAPHVSPMQEARCIKLEILLRLPCSCDAKNRPPFHDSLYNSVATCKPSPKIWRAR